MTYLYRFPSLRRRIGLPFVASLLLMASLCIQSAQAQDQPVNCATALEDAERSYNLGEFDRVINLLSTCVEQNTFSENQLRRVYRLMGLSYIGKQLEGDARAAVAELLTLVPDYEPHPVNDPPTFARMVGEVKAEQLAAIADAQDDPPPLTQQPPAPPETNRKRWLLIGAGAVVVGVLAAVLAGGGGGGGGGLPGPPPLPGGN